VQTASVINLLTTGGVLLVLDQGSKRMVRTGVANGWICWGRVLRIRSANHYKDTYRHGGGRALLVMLWFAALASTIVLHRSGIWFQSPGALFGVALALAGAAGNLLDILQWRYVLNFIDLGWWPVFNLADLGIVTGLALALLY
jgi:signal peptidase II